MSLEQSRTALTGKQAADELTDIIEKLQHLQDGLAAQPGQQQPATVSRSLAQAQKVVQQLQNPTQVILETASPRRRKRFPARLAIGLVGVLILAYLWFWQGGQIASIFNPRPAAVAAQSSTVKTSSTPVPDSLDLDESLADAVELDPLALEPANTELSEELARESEPIADIAIAKPENPPEEELEGTESAKTELGSATLLPSAAVPSSPSVLTPEQGLVAAIQAQIEAITSSYTGGIVSSIEANLFASELKITLSPEWGGFSPERQQAIADEMLSQAQSLNFTKLLLFDPDGELAARSPVIGNQMLLYLKNS
ncbi:MAG: hypothetical protein AAGG02_00605 [Cyanobacteria bacterium P01_H01_bin.15]